MWLFLSPAPQPTSFHPPLPSATSALMFMFYALPKQLLSKAVNFKCFLLVISSLYQWRVLKITFLSLPVSYPIKSRLLSLAYKTSWSGSKLTSKPCHPKLLIISSNYSSPLDCKEIQPGHPKGDHSWVFIGRTDVEAETPILWPPDVKNWLIWKDPDAGKDWGQEEKGMTEDEMVGWCHQLNGHEFGWTLVVDDGQGGLVCCSSWDRKELDTTERLNWTDWILFTISRTSSKT